MAIDYDEYGLGDILLDFKKHTDWIRLVAFSPDGKLGMSGSDDKTVKIFDIKTGEVLLDFKGHTNAVESVAFSPDGKLGMSGSADNTVKVFDIKTGDVLLDFKGHTNYVQSVAFSPDGKLGMSGSIDKTVKIFDIETGDILLDFKRHTNRVASVAFSPDGKLGMSGSRDRTVKIFDIETGEVLLDFNKHTDFVLSVAFSPDGKLGMSGSNDSTVKVFDIKTGEVLLDFKRHTNRVQSVAFSPDGKLGMSGSRDRTVKIFDIETGEVLLDFNKHTHYVQSVAFSPDGKLGMSGSSDNTVKVFSLGGLIQLSKYLIKTNQGIEDLNGSILESFDFENSGFSIQELAEILPKKKNIEAIYCNENVILKLKGNKDIALRDNGLRKGELLISQDILKETIPKATIKGYTSLQLVMPTKDLPLRQVKEVKDIRIKGQDPKNKVRIICSIDEGETWKGYKNDSLIDIDFNNFQEIVDNGLSIIEFNSLKEKWNDILFITEKLRFAYFLDIDDIDDIVHVDDLIATIDMYGYWSTLEKGEDYQYRYSNNSLSVDIYKNGTYKVNYNK